MDPRISKTLATELGMPYQNLIKEKVVELNELVYALNRFGEKTGLNKGEYRSPAGIMAQPYSLNYSSADQKAVVICFVFHVIPAKAGIQRPTLQRWIPASAGMTSCKVDE